MTIRQSIAGVCTATAVLFAPVVSVDLGGTARALIWNETGDAAFDVPQSFKGANNTYTGLHGSLLDTINKGKSDEYLDTADKYRFFFGGGMFSVGANWTTGGPGVPLILSIFRDDGNHTLLRSASFGFDINLSKDTYLFTVSANGTDDPPYFVDFIGLPVFGVDEIVAAFEPAAVTLFGAGLFGLAAAARRRRRAAANR
jgi:hypothetical protein